MTLGEQLCDARKRVGLSLDEVSERTRIRAGLLAAMEDDDFSRCGGNFYARGHLRAVARVLGEDPEPLVRQFDEHHATPDTPPSRRVERVESRPPTVHAARPRWSVVMGAVLTGLLGWGMVRLFTLPSDVEATGAHSTPTPVVTVSPAPTAVSTPPAPVRTPLPQATRPRAVQVTIAAASNTYVRIRTAHGLRLFSGTLRSGAAHSVTYGGSIRVLLGVPKNIRVYVNGIRVYPRAARFTVTLTGTIQRDGR